MAFVPCSSCEVWIIAMSAVPESSTPRDTRRLTLVVVLNVVIIALIVLCVALWFFGTAWSYHLVGDYDLDRGRIIKIYGEQPPIPRTGQLRYEVIVNGEVIVSHDSEESEFFETVLSSDERNPRGVETTMRRGYNTVEARERIK